MKHPILVAILLALANPWSASAASDLPVVSVRAAKRLILTDMFARTPDGSLGSLAFVFQRSGETNQSLSVPFVLSGLAEEGRDYVRVLDGGTSLTGAWQQVTFAPGERFQTATFAIIADDNAEGPEFVRVQIAPPIQNGIVPPMYRNGMRACATAWMIERQCARSVPTPSGGEACLELEPFRVPRAFFTTARCGNLTAFPFPFPSEKVSRSSR